MFDVITLGSATVDVFIDTVSQIVRDKRKHRNLIAYPVGSKILIQNIQFETGGGGTNTAVAISRFGLKAGYIGKLGKDENSDRILNVLKKEKVAFLGSRGNEMSGYSVILDSIGHDRTILTYKGCNNSLAKVDLKKINAKWLYSSSMMGKSFETAKKIVNYAAKKGINIAFNPSNYQAEKGLRYLNPILKHTNILSLNDEEAALLVGKAKIQIMLKRLKKHIKKEGIAIITEGSKGVHCYDGSYIYYIKPRKIKVEESTGAGDAFASSFLAALIKTNNIETAMKIGLVNSESVIQAIGAKNNLLSWSNAVKEAKKIKVDKRVMPK